jgi:hypothetical protein
LRACTHIKEARTWIGRGGGRRGKNVKEGEEGRRGRKIENNKERNRREEKLGLGRGEKISAENERTKRKAFFTHIHT